MKRSILYILAGLLMASCSSEPQMVGIGIDAVYSTYRMRTLRLHPEFSGTGYRWSMDGSDGSDSVVCTDRTMYFVAPSAGEYRIRLHIDSPTDPVDHEVLVKVWDEEIVYTRYITAVLEYRPAPGQFVNELPKYEAGDTEATMCAKVLDCIGGRNDILVSLGAYGGYVTFSFDHTVLNVPGEYDFRIDGNAFYAATNPNPDAPDEGGSSEPGIVMVSLDENGNGLPDDTWYELTGSEYHSPATSHGYSVTYRRPAADHEAVRVDNTIIDGEYIGYTASDGTEGYIQKLIYHRQDYWPAWIDAETLTFRGSRLAPNAVDESGQGSYYVQYSYPWGYADNQPNNMSDRVSFNIDWAVDSLGRPVRLPGADFIRVYTGIQQQCGWLGETSTEISHAEDLHIQ